MNFRAALYKAFNIYPQIRDIHEYSGDSRTVGIGATDNVNYCLQGSWYLAAPSRVYCRGASGNTMTDRLANFYNNSTPFEAMIMAQPHGPNRSVDLFDGYNDINGGSSAATIYMNQTTFISQVHALGVKAVLAEETEQNLVTTGPGILASLQSLQLANSAGADIVVPFAADPVWGCPPCLATGTQGYTPQTFINLPHPTTYGYGFMAKDDANAVNPFMK